MKTLRIMAACLTLALAATVHAQGSSLGQGQKPTPPQSGTNPQGQLKIGIVGGLKTADSTAAPFKFDGNGYPYFTDAARDRDNFQIVPVCDDTVSIGQLIDTKSTKGFPFTAESSAVIPCFQYHHFTLMMRVVPAGGDTTTRFRFAVQIRKHIDATGDSSSTFAWTSFSPTPTAVTGLDDSLGHFTAATFFGGTGAATGITGWANERTVILSATRGNAVGSSSVGQSFGWPGGVAIDLVDARGQWFWAPYISVRVRCLSGGGTAANKPRIIAWLAMGS